MKKFTFKTFTVLVTFLLSSTFIYSQIDYDSLANVYVDYYDTVGYVFFKDEPALEPGDPIGMYKDLTDDENHDLVLVKDWKDGVTDYRHYKYQEYFKDLKVEAAEYIEHALDGQLKYANGMIAQMNAEVSEKAELTEEEALESLMYYLIEEELNYAWQDSLWEAEIKLETGDSTATYYPEGELMWALDNHDRLQWLIPSNRYTLAYRFEITAVSPHTHRAYFVNANTGAVFRDGDLICYNGPANTLHHGSQTIDDAWSGPNSAYILKTNDNGRNVHTKVDNGWDLFSITSEVQDADGNWGYAYQKATTSHWFVTQAWDFYDDVYNYIGLKDNGKKIKVWISEDWDKAAYTYGGGSDNIVIGDEDEDYVGTLDVVGHEFTHGVTHYTADLTKQAEPGALNESFSDIFGLLIEEYTEGGVNDWLIGEDHNTLRSLNEPKNYGKHFINPNNCSAGRTTGTPDTYLGEYWHPTDKNCDSYGIHTNCGVQNYWFYLLSHGGSGVNDNGYSYNVQGIGTEKAGIIAYLTLTTQLTSGSQYYSSWMSSVFVSLIMYGECSNEFNQTIKAWAAVGLPWYQNQCMNLGETEKSNSGMEIYPNPTENFITLKVDQLDDQKLGIYSLDGRLLQNLGTLKQKSTQINLSQLSNGIYLLRVDSENNQQTFKIVKQ